MGFHRRDPLQSISRNFDHKCSELPFILELTSQFVNKVPDWSVK
jgi:hypothetical protein